MRMILGGLAVTAALAVGLAAQQPKSGLSLATLTWRDAEAALTPSTVVVLPLGAASLEHGPHMKLDSSDRLARYLAERVRTAADVVIAPPLTYHFYPAFAEYPGSTSLSQNTARDMTVEIVRSLSKFGPRRFYVLNTGITTMTPLKEAADALADRGILLGYTDIRGRVLNAPVTRQQTPTGGPGHADEIETSMMLFVDPASVDMSKAVREYGRGSGALTRLPDTPGVLSAWGVIGDATVATKVKGQAFVEAVVAGALEDIEGIRKSPLPVEKTTPTLVPRAAPPRPATSPEPQQPNGCMPPDERAIRAIGDRFNLLWRNMDSDGIGKLFGDTGDMRHPDGTIEKGEIVIRENRRQLFLKREYRGSIHTLTLSDIQCLAGSSVAVADGKWELRLEGPATSGAPARNLGSGLSHSGLCTLVLVGHGGAWGIQAWRYTVDPENGTPPPTTLKQPGFIGRGGG